MTIRSMRCRVPFVAVTVAVTVTVTVALDPTMAAAAAGGRAPALRRPAGAGIGAFLCPAAAANVKPTAAQPPPSSGTLTPGSHAPTVYPLLGLGPMFGGIDVTGRLAQPRRRRGTCCRPYHGTSALRLNRFLLDPSEIDVDDGDVPTATLRREDYRTVHAAKVLGLQNGDALRAGVVGTTTTSAAATGDADGEGDDAGGEGPHAGLVTDAASIEWIAEGKNRKAQPTKNGDPPGSLRIALRDLRQPEDDPASSSALSVSLILALPRPLQLGRMLPMIAQLGVDQLVLTGAQKVPKDYFGSHLFRKPDELQRLLVEGLCQAGDVRLPNVTVVRSLKNFLEDDMESMFPTEGGGGMVARVVAHPQRTGGPAALRMREVEFSPPAIDDRNRQKQPSPPRLVLAVGPEGGWAEPYELDLLSEHGFQQVTLGTRVLRSDVAVVSLLSLAHDVCAAKAAAVASAAEASLGGEGVLGASAEKTR